MLERVEARARPQGKRRRQWVPCPQTVPLLNYLCMTPTSGMILRYADTLTPDSRRKPKDAKGMQLFVALTDQGPAPVDDARYWMTCTKNPVAVMFDPEDDGKVATFYARWVSARGETGPWSLPLCMRVVA